MYNLHIMRFKIKRDAKKDENILIAVRLPSYWLKKIDAIAQGASTKGKKIKRSEVIRQMIEYCLEEKKQ